MSPQPAAPHEFLKLAGHPLRWRLLGELAHSDRLVHELTALSGEPQNLVSYHLGKLRQGRLVSARRSAADRRDTYYSLDLDRFGEDLSATGAALHPGLRLAPVGDAAAVPPCRILFLCTGNSARSQMAEALARAWSGGAIDAHSAGSHPKPVHPNAVRALREAHGLDMSDQVSKSVDLYAGQAFDQVITLCDRVREVCPDFPGRLRTVHWSLANPATDGDDAATYPRFQQTAAELATRVRYLLAALAPSTPQPGGPDGRPQ